VFYFQHHVGDYRRDTGHLTLLEHGIYRQLIDLYYITEKPLDASAMRLVCVRTAEEEQAYKRVLADFFHERKGKYFHKRCDFEISRYKDKSSKATDSARTRWNKIKDLADADALPPHCDDDADGMLTKEPINLITKEPNNLQTKEPKNLTKATSTTRRQAAMFIPENVSEIVWKDFLSTRKTKLTQTALTGIAKQADIAGISLEAALQECCTRGWQSFKADWVSQNKSKSKTSNNEDNFEKARKLIFGATTEKDISDESERV
jgi:uncharacterized protein YdaU (DUF1376 family)